MFRELYILWRWKICWRQSFAFCALNYLNGHTNASQGQYYVNHFNSQYKSLENLQDAVNNNVLEYRCYIEFTVWCTTYCIAVSLLLVSGISIARVITICNYLLQVRIWGVISIRPNQSLNMTSQVLQSKPSALAGRLPFTQELNVSLSERQSEAIGSYKRGPQYPQLRSNSLRNEPRLTYRVV